MNREKILDILFHIVFSSLALTALVLAISLVISLLTQRPINTEYCYIETQDNKILGGKCTTEKDGILTKIKLEEAFYKSYDEGLNIEVKQ